MKSQNIHTHTDTSQKTEEKRDPFRDNIELAGRNSALSGKTYGIPENFRKIPPVTI